MQRERQSIEDAGHGSLAAHEQGPKRLFEAVDVYLNGNRLHCSRRAIEFEEERLVSLKRHFADVPLTAITAKAIADYQRKRHDAGASNRTINMDVGDLCRVLKSCGRWRALADDVRNLPERQRPVGRVLTPQERQRLFDGASSHPEREHVYCTAVVAANTSMRPVEVKHLRRRDVDLAKKLLYVRRSKNETSHRGKTSHRVIPLNASAITAVARMPERADLLGHMEPDHYIWPACQWGHYDPAKPMEKWDTAWRALRDAACLPRSRFHDLWHTVITELPSWASPTTCSNRSAATSRGVCSSTTRTSASTRSGRHSTRWTNRGGAETGTGRTTGTTPENARKAEEFRWFSTSPGAARHSHVTVWLWPGHRPPVNC